MLKVLYNALHLTGNFSGVQYTEEQLMRAAFRNPDPSIEFKVICDKNYQPNFPVSSQQLIKTNIDSSQRWQRIRYEHIMIARLFAKQNAHMLHCPAYILPWNWKKPSIVTIHDTIALDFPEYCSNANRAYFRFALPRSIRRASKIIAVSQTVKDNILRKFSIDPSRIEVIYHGIDDIFHEVLSTETLTFVQQKYQLPKKFILYVGNIEPKKNIARLIDAYLDLTRQTDLPHSLVIAGQFAWKYQDVMQKTNKRILFPGYIDLPDLPSLYTLADLFVFPSLYEGFGIPPLEAMACGTPVIVSNAGALPEITDGNAFITDPLSIDSIKSAMDKLLHNHNLRDQFIRKGRLHAQKFKWEKTWAATAQLYQSLNI